MSAKKNQKKKKNSHTLAWRKLWTEANQATNVLPGPRNREVVVVDCADAEVANLDELEPKLDLLGLAARQDRPQLLPNKAPKKGTPKP